MDDSNKPGDVDGEWTFVSKRGVSVVDYVITNSEGWEGIRRVRVGHRTESDHLPVEVEVGVEILRESKRKKTKEKEQEKKIPVWTEEAIREYRLKENDRKIEGETVEELWNNLKETTLECIKWRRVGSNAERDRIGEDWNRQSKRKKRRVKKAYNKWRAGKGSRESYLKEKGELRNMRREKERERQKVLEEEIREVKSEQDVWKFINKFRRRRKVLNSEITMEEWRDHFSNLLGGKEKKDTGEIGKRRERGAGDDGGDKC